MPIGLRWARARSLRATSCSAMHAARPGAGCAHTGSTVYCERGSGVTVAGAPADADASAGHSSATSAVSASAHSAARVRCEGAIVALRWSSLIVSQSAGTRSTGGHVRQTSLRGPAAATNCSGAHAPPPPPNGALQDHVRPIHSRAMPADERSSAQPPRAHARDGSPRPAAAARENSLEPSARDSRVEDVEVAPAGRTHDAGAEHMGAQAGEQPRDAAAEHAGAHAGEQPLDATAEQTDADADEQELGEREPAELDEETRARRDAALRHVRKLGD